MAQKETGYSSVGEEVQRTVRCVTLRVCDVEVKVPSSTSAKGTKRGAGTPRGDYSIAEKGREPVLRLRNVEDGGFTCA